MKVSEKSVIELLRKLPELLIETVSTGTGLKFIPAPSSTD